MSALPPKADIGTPALNVCFGPEADMGMPEMSGLELLPKAKAMRPDVPVIMITAYGDAETKRNALKNGAEALLTKPIDFTTAMSALPSIATAKANSRKRLCPLYHGKADWSVR